MLDQIHRILAKFEQAAQLPRKRQQEYQHDKDTSDFFRFFGADKHNYVMNPPISAREIEDWERKYQAALPLAYRTFLEQVGNGGAGPYHGLLPLERWDYGCNVGVKSIDEWPSTPCRLLEHFPLDPDCDAWLTQVGGPDWNARFEADTWAPMVGSLTLCDYGCGGYIYLILNGPLEGRICFSEHLSKPNFYPQQNFLDWYEGWLDYVVTGDPTPFYGKPRETSAG